MPLFVLYISRMSQELNDVDKSIWKVVFAISRFGNERRQLKMEPMVTFKAAVLAVERYLLEPLV
jgi:hypothetical protein